MSTKRAAQLREYSQARKTFLEAHPICQVWLAENGWSQDGLWFTKGNLLLSAGALREDFGAPASEDIHHKNKRHGARLNEQQHWLAVSRANHQVIEDNKQWARERGYLLNF